MIDTDDKERQAIEKRNKQRVDRDADDVRRVISTVEGRRLLAKLMFKACATDSNLDLIETSFNANTASGNFTEGSRRFGILIFNEIMRVSPQTMIQMRREAGEDQRSQETKNG
jgi:hypothetical protein